MTIVLDYAWQHPSISTIKSLGAIGVIRYLSNDSSKNLSSGEYAALKNAGLAVSLVWETTATRPLSGYDGGKYDAQYADRLADALGYPIGACIYYAVDFDANEMQRQIIQRYMQGARDGSKRPSGVYGSYYVLEDCQASNVCDYFWQTQAWSGGQLSDARDLLQVVQGSTQVYDVNHVSHADWGQDNKHSPATFPAFPLSSGHWFGAGGTLSGHNLHLWQQKMHNRGWDIVADDIYGPVTKQVATDFQREKHLVVDGLIGIHTWNAAWLAPVT